jgi:hypothetical protein
MRRSTTWAAAMVGFLGVIGSATTLPAQISFGNRSFGITVGPQYGGYGGGYGGYGVGIGGYPPGYGGFGPGYRGYVGPSYAPAYSAPPAYYGGNSQPSRIVVQQPTKPREGADLPIKIVSPDDAGTPLTYTLNGYEYTIEPGNEQLLKNDRAWVIRFDRGEDFGTAEYSLSPGTYEFELTKRGWEVFHDADLSKLMPQPDGASPTKKNAVPKKTPPQK